MAAETVIESFCERCGTRYTFEPVRKRESKLVGLGKQLGILLEDHAAGLAQRDPFHGTFHFCLECRQYTCPRCWNESAGFCLGCMPLPGAPDMAALDAAEAEADLEAADLRERATAEHDHLNAPDAWPDADLARRHAAADAWPAAALAAERGAIVAAQPDPEPEPERIMALQVVPDAALADDAGWAGLESEATFDVTALAAAADADADDTLGAADAGLVWFDDTADRPGADAPAEMAVNALGAPLTAETDVDADMATDLEPVDEADGSLAIMVAGAGAVGLLAVATALEDVDDWDEAERADETVTAEAALLAADREMDLDADAELVPAELAQDVAADPETDETVELMAAETVTEAAEAVADPEVVAEDADAEIAVESEVQAEAAAEETEAVADAGDADAEIAVESEVQAEAAAEETEAVADAGDADAEIAVEAEAVESEAEAVESEAEAVESDAVADAEAADAEIAAEVIAVESEADAEAADAEVIAESVETDAIAVDAIAVETVVDAEAQAATEATSVTAEPGAVAALATDDEDDWADLIRHLPPTPEDDPWTDDWSAMAPSLGPDIAAAPEPAAPVAPAPIPAPAPVIAWQLTPPTTENEPRPTAWPPLGPVFRPAPTPAQAAPHPSVLTPRHGTGGVLARGQAAGATPSALPNGVRPCRNCELPLSASARFCRRCGRPQG